MGNSRVVGTIGVAVLSLSALQAQTVWAQAAYPASARAYNMQFVRAMDECVGPIVTVVNPGNVGGCVQANSVTDTAIAMSWGRLKAYSSKNGVKMLVTAKGIAPTTSKVALQITLRTSNTLGTPPGSKTYEDTTIICGTQNGGACGRYYPVSATGNIREKQELGACLSANSLSASLAIGNIQFVDAALINCDTGSVMGVPGVLK